MEQHIRESNLIEGIDSPDEDAQSLVAWQYLIKQPQITHQVIKKVQKIITINQADLRPDQRGYYRNLSKCNVRVGKHLAPHFFIVPHLMENWLLDFHQYPPIENHVHFERIHPFADGNGRTGRMLMWWQDMQKGNQPHLFEACRRQEYYQLFTDYMPPKRQYEGLWLW